MNVVTEKSGQHAAGMAVCVCTTPAAPRPQPIPSLAGNVFAPPTPRHLKRSKIRSCQARFPQRDVARKFPTPSTPIDEQGARVFVVGHDFRGPAERQYRFRDGGRLSRSVADLTVALSPTHLTVLSDMTADAPRKPPRQRAPGFLWRQYRQRCATRCVAPPER